MEGASTISPGADGLLNTIKTSCHDGQVMVHGRWRPKDRAHGEPRQGSRRFDGQDGRGQSTDGGARAETSLEFKIDLFHEH